MRFLPPTMGPLLLLVIFLFPFGRVDADELPCPDGVALYSAGRLEEAVAAFEACLEIHPEHPALMLALAQIELDRQRPNDALGWTARAVEADPTSTDALHRHGQALLAAGDAQGARRTWERGLGLSMEHSGLLGDLAVLLMREGEEQAAYGLLTQLVRTGTATATTHRTLSDLAGKRSLWHQALFHWNGYLETGRAITTDDLCRASELAILAEDTTYAVTAARRAAEHAPGAKTWAVLGRACFAARRFEEARENLAAAVEADPGDSATRFNLANTLQLLGRGDEAEGQFRHYVAQVPDDPFGFLNFATLLRQKGDLAEALLQVQQACVLDSTLADAFLLQATLQESLGDDAGALASIEHLQGMGAVADDRLEAWRLAIEQQLAERDRQNAEGLFELQHLVTPDADAADAAVAELARGADFGSLVTRFSIGPTAALGGGIGWVDPDDLAEELGAVVRDLAVDEISPPIASGGLYHMFRRVR